MARGRDQFVGAAGQSYVAYALALRQINASLTLGNGPSVDVLVSSHDGRRTLALQVKTTRNAYRRNRYGREGCEWRVGAAVIGNHAESFWYALVDLRESPNAWNPRVFFVPSRWVAEFVKPDWDLFLYFLPTTGHKVSEERWDLVQGYLSEQPDAIAWANDWPGHLLCKWGAAPNQALAAAQKDALG
jgi:hypothetical protein